MPPPLKRSAATVVCARAMPRVQTRVTHPPDVPQQRLASPPAVAGPKNESRFHLTDLWFGAYRLARAPVLGAILGAALLSAPAEAGAADVIRCEKSVAPVERVFDAEALLKKLGVHNYQFRTGGYLPAEHLKAKDGAKKISFDYPDFKRVGTSTKLELIEYSEYEPTPTLNKLELKDQELMRWLKEIDPGCANNFEAANMKTVRAHLDRRLANNETALCELAINNVRRLTPKQAANLAGLI